MVLSLITLAATVPLLATSTIQLQEQSQKTKDEKVQEMKLEKCLMLARTSPRLSAHRREQLNNTMVVLHDNRMYLEKQSTSEKHPFTGYFLPFPNAGEDGLVTTINAEKMLNWVYIDSETYQIKYGVRAEAQSQLTHPMSLVHDEAEDEWRLVFKDREGFLAVEESEGVWGLYFDVDDDSLKDKVNGKATVEIELVRFGIENQS